MQNRRNLDRDNRRQGTQRNYAAEDSRNRFQDQDYDHYFPQQNAYHPQSYNRNRDEGRQNRDQNQYQKQDQSQSQFGSQTHDWSPSAPYGQSSFGSNYGGSSNYGTGYGGAFGYGSDYGSINFGDRSGSQFGSSYQTEESQRRNEHPTRGNMNRSDEYGQGSYQSWSQPVRNDEASQTSRSFYGKGPKNFKRSDERIREEVNEALFRDHAVDASEIEVSVQNGEVTLSGTVESRRMKRLAEDCVESVSGVTDIKNEIRVQSPLTPERTTSASQVDEFQSERLASDRTEKPKGRSAPGSNRLM